MNSSTATPGAARDVGPDVVAAAIMRELRKRFSESAISYLTSRETVDDAGGAEARRNEIRVINEAGGEASGPVLVTGTAPRSRRSIVAAAVDDDANPGRILRYAAAEARRLDVPLRVVHVWTGFGTSRPGARMSRHDRMCDADCLLSAVLYDYLTQDEADATEREILHDEDAVSALIALSVEASLIVVGARSGPATGDEPLGDTVRALLGRTACPLAVLPPCAEPED
jgi:nucleotide-binding universal stress UspA family protein